jgi:hypothetical protein
VDLKFCKMDDGRPAIGTGNRPIEFCREHYISELGDQFQQFKVIFRDRPPEGRQELAIACAKTGEDIKFGGTVWLDPVETHIPSLLWAGDIEPVEAPKPAAKAKSTEA